MELNAKQLKCGNCGNETVRVFDVSGVLMLECTQCKSTTKITVSKPEIELEFGDGSDGRMCIF